MNPDEIWLAEPTAEAKTLAANYAAITLPWTFNRMMRNTSSRGQRDRALNIVKGVVAQLTLYNVLIDHGIKCELEQKSYRDDDTFDFRIDFDGTFYRADLKTVNVYNDHLGNDREPLSRELNVHNCRYFGRDWRHFFPMLVPHSQINQDKDLYIFGIAISDDFRQTIDSEREQSFIAAFPFGKHLGFLAQRYLCNAREEHQKGIRIRCRYVPQSMLAPSVITLKIHGEWDGKRREEELELPQNSSIESTIFSSVNCFQLIGNIYANFDGRIEVVVSENALDVLVRDYRRRDLNVPPAEPLVLTPEDFCDLILPDDYIIYFLGWIWKLEFLEAFRKYPAWIWPDDSEDPYANQRWTKVTRDDRKRLAAIGFEEYITRDGVTAGFLKGIPFGGACCYYYPNVYRGGLKETNLYVLPCDLYPLEDLGNRP